MKKECVFCKIAGSDSSQLQEYDQPIFESKNFFVVSALGHFTEGYVLICTKVHYLNMGALDSNIIEEFEFVKDYVRNMLYDVYGKRPIFFEHGAANIKNSMRSCIDHAHLHAIPIEIFDLEVFSSPYLINSKDLSVKNITEYSQAGNPYFYVEISDKRMMFYDAILLPCQYGRRIVAKLVNKSDKWDWRKYSYESDMIKTTRQLKDWIGRKNGR